MIDVVIEHDNDMKTINPTSSKKELCLVIYSNFLKDPSVKQGAIPNALQCARVEDLGVYVTCLCIKICVFISCFCSLQIHDF